MTTDGNCKRPCDITLFQTLLIPKPCSIYRFSGSVISINSILSKTSVCVIAGKGELFWRLQLLTHSQKGKEILSFFHGD